MDRIDLRSDTVTLPSPGMRKAMAEAPVGDDQYGEDPSVNRLQERVAELLGKEAALFVPSGTMANQIGLKVLTHPGDDPESALAAVKAQPKGVTGNPRAHIVFPPTTLVTVENTHNRGGGVVFPQGEIEAICAEGNEHLRIGKENYMLSPDGLLMPTKKDQTPPDLRYFNKARQ